MVMTNPLVFTDLRIYHMFQHTAAQQQHTHQQRNLAYVHQQASSVLSAWMPRVIANQPCAHGLPRTTLGAPQGPASAMILVLQPPPVRVLQPAASSCRRPALVTSRRCGGRKRVATTSDSRAMTPPQLSQPRLLSAPGRRPIARRRSHDDLRVGAVLDSMARSPSMRNIRALEKMAAVLPAAILNARDAVPAGKRATSPTTPTNNDAPEKLEIQQAEKDVSKLMAEMASMAC